MTAGHFPLGAFALADAGGTGVCKKRRRRFAAKTKHFIRNGANFPLGAVAAAKAEEIVKEEDPMAFLIISSATEIYGEGYKNIFSEKL